MYIINAKNKLSATFYKNYFIIIVKSITNKDFTNDFGPDKPSKKTSSAYSDSRKGALKSYL
jgi:hypothetical protein